MISNKTIEYNDKQYVTMSFNPEDICLEDVYKYYEKLSKELDKKIILVPKQIDIDIWGKNELIEYRDSINKILEEN